MKTLYLCSLVVLLTINISAQTTAPKKNPNEILPVKGNNVNLLIGEWVNSNSQTKDLTKLIFPNENSVHAFAKCSPTDCDWKLAKLTPTGPGAFKAIFNLQFETHELDIVVKSLKLGGIDQLDVTDREDYFAKGGKPGFKKQFQYVFVKK